MIKFDGRKIRDEILEDLKVKVSGLQRKPVLAVIWIGEDFASARYIEVKQRAADKIGIHFDLIKYSNQVEKDEVLKKIDELNHDEAVVGLMIQIPVPNKFQLSELISKISPEKDVDGLRFCSDLSCDFHPPVTLSVLRAIKDSGINLFESKVAIIGKGFLVGSPLAKYLDGKVADLRLADVNTPYLGTITIDADLIISATGKANIINLKIIKNGVVLIDAGTTEVGGKLAGDVDPKCYLKAGFYTPVPGGIGPVTVAMLMKNVVEADGKFKND